MRKQRRETIKKAKKHSIAYIIFALCLFIEKQSLINFVFLIFLIGIFINYLVEINR